MFGGLESSMERAVAETGAQTLLITMPSAPGSAVRRVVDAALALHLDVRTVPSMTDLLDGSRGRLPRPAGSAWRTSSGGRW